MKTDTKDMTTGSPGRLLLAFSMPLMLGNLFQQLYTFADAVIVGQCVSANALAALGATEWLTFIMFGVISGITQGCSVVIAGFFGKKQMNELKRAICSGLLIAVLGAAGFTLIGQMVLTPVLRLLRTPPEVFDLTREYLRILYAGVPVTFLYNITAAVLRALGNSKKPLNALIIASLGHIALDLLFVAEMDMGIAGAAYGTVLAQLLAAVYCGAALRRIRFQTDERLTEAGADGQERYDRPERPDTDYGLMGQETALSEKRCCEESKTGLSGRIGKLIDRQILREQIRMGIPMGVQNIITAAGGLVVQATVNGFGILFLTGYAAANKLYVLLEIAATSYGHGILTYTAQNKGIGSDKRIRAGLKSALIIGSITALVMSAVMVFAGRPILGLFIKETETGVEEMLRVGCHYLCVLAAGFPLLYCLYVVRACIQGMGDSVIPMLSSFMQVAMRIMCALFLTRLIGHTGVFWGEVAAWAGADIFLGIVCAGRLRKEWVR